MRGLIAVLFAASAFGQFPSTLPPSGGGISTVTQVTSLFTGCSGSQYLGYDGACHNASGSGTVTSVALTLPSWLAVSGSPVTTSGTIAVTAATGQTQNLFLATPNGSSGALSLRAILAADLPTLNQSTTGNAATATALAANGTNCAAGNYPLGVDASGNAENCTAAGSGGISGATTNALVTAASSTTLQTICATCTLDSSGNMSIAGTFTSGGAGGSLLTLSGSTSGTMTIAPAAAASGAWTLPAGTDSFVGASLAATLLNKTLTAPVLTAPALGTPASGVMTNVTGLPLSTGVTGILPVANGGTGTTSPGIVAGTNVTVTGTWPNQTVNSSGTGTGLANPTVTAGTGGLFANLCASKDAGTSTAFVLPNAPGGCGAGIATSTVSAAGTTVLQSTQGQVYTAIADNTVTAGHWVVGYVTTAGRLADSGQTSRLLISDTVATYGYATTSATAGNTFSVFWLGAEYGGLHSSGNVTVTTKGDLQGFDTAANKIPVGADGTSLVADSTQPLGVKWGSVSASGAYYAAWIWGNASGPAFGTPQWTAPSGSGNVSVSVRQGIIPVTGTLRNFYMGTQATESTGSLTCTLQWAAPGGTPADTTVTVTVANGAVAGTYSDLTHTKAVTVGDVITVKCTQNTSGTAANMTGFAFTVN